MANKRQDSRVKIVKDSLLTFGWEKKILPKNRKRV